MESILNDFKQRWNTVTSETLSSVHRQLANVTFDISVINHDFHISSNEWFDGKLAPSLWYKKLSDERPDAAERFKEYVSRITFHEHVNAKPSHWKYYVITALTLPVCYGLLCLVTKMGIVSKSVLSIGLAVMVWYICQTFAQKKQFSYEENVVNYYRQQLEIHLNEILKILS